MTRQKKQMAMSGDKPLRVYAPVSVKVGHLVKAKYQNPATLVIHSSYLFKSAPHEMTTVR
jgi:hypothetical protein